MRNALRNSEFWHDAAVEHKFFQATSCGIQLKVMGRRKTKAKKVAKKKRPTVPTSFKCLFCNVADAVSVKLDQV